MSRYRTHITFTDENARILNEYQIEHPKGVSSYVNYLMECGIKYLSKENNTEININLLNKILSKTIYTRDLLEQLYSDLEIDNHTNPNNNKSLNQFKSKKNKDYFNE